MVQRKDKQLIKVNRLAAATAGSSAQQASYNAEQTEIPAHTQLLECNVDPSSVSSQSSSYPTCSSATALPQQSINTPPDGAIGGETPALTTRNLPQHSISSSTSDRGRSTGTQKALPSRITRPLEPRITSQRADLPNGNLTSRNDGSIDSERNGGSQAGSRGITGHSALMYGMTIDYLLRKASDWREEFRFEEQAACLEQVKVMLETPQLTPTSNLSAVLQTTYNNCGACYLELRQYSSAESHIFKAIQLLDTLEQSEVENIRCQVIAFKNLARLYEETGSEEKAESYRRQIDTMLERLGATGESMHCISLMVGLADEYSREQKTEIALDYYQKALDLMESSEMHMEELAKVYSGLGLCYDKLKRPTEALDCRKQAAGVWEELVDFTEEGSSEGKKCRGKLVQECLNLHTSYKDCGRLADAESVLIKVVQKQREMDQTGDEQAKLQLPNNLHSLGMMLVARQELKEARETFEEERERRTANGETELEQLEKLIADCTVADQG